MELALVLEFELAVPLVCTMELIIELCAAEAQWSMCGRLFAGRARQLKAVSEDVECVKYVGTLSVTQNVGHTVQTVLLLYSIQCILYTMYQVPCTVCCAICAVYYHNLW